MSIPGVAVVQREQRLEVRLPHTQHFARKLLAILLVVLFDRRREGGDEKERRLRRRQEGARAEGGVERGVTEAMELLRNDLRRKERSVSGKGGKRGGRDGLEVSAIE
jgi:hypothetical protein